MLVFVISRVAGRSRGVTVIGGGALPSFSECIYSCYPLRLLPFLLLYLTTLFSTPTCFSTDIAHVPTPITYLVTKTALLHFASMVIAVIGIELEGLETEDYLQ